MSEFKGTKGKWIMECPKNSNGYMYINDKIGGNGNIATCYTVDYSEWYGNNITTETKANALLISKAPEILEMLKRLRNDYGNYTQNILQESHRMNRINEIEQLIKEATEL